MATSKRRDISNRLDYHLTELLKLHSEVLELSEVDQEWVSKKFEKLSTKLDKTNQEIIDKTKTKTKTND